MADTTHNGTGSEDFDTSAYGLGQDLLNLDGELAEFRDTCVFFCDAVISIIERDTMVDRATLAGVLSVSEQVKQDVLDLVQQMGRLRAKMPFVPIRKH